MFVIVPVIFQADERTGRISSDLCSESLNLSAEQDNSELGKRKKKTKKTFMPRLSVEMQVVRMIFRSCVFMSEMYKVNLCLSCSSVCLCGQIEPVDTAEFMNAASECKLDIIDRYLEDGGNPNAHDEVGLSLHHSKI